MRRLHRALHHAAERDAALQLLGDVLGHQLGVDFRLADFDDVQVHFVGRVLLHVALQLLDVGALLADHDARTSRMDGDAALLVRTLDHDARHAGRPSACSLRYSRILMSSCSSLPYSFLPAYQRESQVRLMPRRKPIGLTF